MTNFDKWKIYCSNLPTPNIMIDWAYYYMISAALQRRVWVGDINGPHPLFPNIYVAFIGEPGIGKTMVTKPVNMFLQYWKADKKKNEDKYFDQHEFDVIAKKSQEEPTLIQVGPDDTTYEALCRNMSRCIRGFWPNVDINPKVPYLHSSLCFTLEELASLFKKHSESVVSFITRAYDSATYSYESVGRGKDTIKNPCLSFLAGTTMDHMRRIFGTKDALLTGGLASRFIFITAEQPRFRTGFPIPLSDEAKAIQVDLLMHIKHLTEVFGPVDFGQDGLDYFNNWWVNVEPKTRPNTNERLKDYYARKNITVIKMAMILWFTENTTLKVTDGPALIQRAIDVCAIAEQDMHKVLKFDNKNPIHDLAKDIYKYIKRKDGVRKGDIQIDFHGEAPDGLDSIEKALEYLVQTAKTVVYENGLYKAKEK